MVKVMEIKSYKCYNAKSEIEIEPTNWIQEQQGNMNSVLKYLSEFKPELVDDYVHHLIKRLRKAIDSIEKNDGFYDFPDGNQEFENLDKFPKLKNLTREFLLVHLNPLMKSQNSSEKYIVYGLNRAKAGERISYHRVKSFAEMLGKEAGIELYTKILTEIVKDMQKKNPQKSDCTVTKSREGAVKWWCETGLADFTYCVIDEHMDIYRFDKCFTYEALKDFNDPDIAYIASCYIGDIPTFNDGRIIHMRRTQTLHHGDFCDELYWDSRVHDNPKQPTLDFTRNLGK